MRTLSPETAAWAQSGALTRAHVWRFTRRDGAVFAFTDHDAPLRFDGLVCEPVLGLSGGEIELTDDLSPDTASLSGALDSQTLTEADLAAGLWDGAEIDIFAVDWRNTDHRVAMFSGVLGETTWRANAFEAEVRGLQACLNAPVGRSLSRRCDARLGDGRCGVVLDAFVVQGVIEEIAADGSVIVAGVTAPTDDWFVDGEAIFTNGQRMSIAGQRTLSGDRIAVRFSGALASGFESGQAISLTVGCDKSHAMCAGRFSNILNFQGFPHMPGNDVLTAGAHAGEPRDGASRFR
jgi:uncharacterized phage protein (TIGR02218 family)